MKATLNNESNDMFLRQATVFLNNAGVYLLRRGCIRQALETFTEALQAAAKLGGGRSAHMEENNNNNINNKDRQVASSPLLAPGDSDDIKNLLEKAYHRLSHTKPSTLSDMNLEVISDDENPAWIQSRCLDEGTEPSIKTQGRNFLIHTDHLDVEVPSEEEMAIQCSIVCYNYGVAYLCLSTLPASRPFVEQLYTGALKMFQLAFPTLPYHHSIKEKLPPDQMNRALITGLLVLRNLIFLSTTLPGMTKEREEYEQYLIHLKQSIHEFCEFHHIDFSPPTARAA